MGSLPYILNLINLLLRFVPVGTQLYQTYQADKTLVEQIIAENRTPTDAEWDTLNHDVAGLEAQIDAAAAAAGG